MRPEAFQAKLWTVRTTRVPVACAWLMIDVIAELVQPDHPDVIVPSLLRRCRLPAASVPTPKYAMVEILSYWIRSELLLTCQYGRQPNTSRRSAPGSTRACGSMTPLSVVGEVEATAGRASMTAAGSPIG